MKFLAIIMLLFSILCMFVPFPSQRLKYIDIAVNNTDPSERSATGTSLNPDLLERSKVSVLCRTMYLLAIVNFFQ